MNAAFSREETVRLLRRAQQGDEAAREELCAANTPLVKSIVRRFLGRGVEYDDLYQLGCLGLLKAIAGFDPSLETQFSTYAVPLIMGEMRRHLRDDGAVKVSRTLKQLAWRAKNERERLQKEGCDPSAEELARALGVTADELLLALDAQRPVASLDAPLDNDEGNLYMLLGGKDETLSVDMRDLIAHLEERERLVVVLRYYKGVTQGEAARVLGLSQAQISRIEARALQALRRAI